MAEIVNEAIEKTREKSYFQVINNDQFIHNDCTYVDKTNDLDCICTETSTKVHLLVVEFSCDYKSTWRQLIAFGVYISVFVCIRDVCVCVDTRERMRMSEWVGR